MCCGSKLDGRMSSPEVRDLGASIPEISRLAQVVEDKVVTYGIQLVYLMSTVHLSILHHNKHENP